MRPSGLEPPTPTMSRWCSNQLSYGRTSDEAGTTQNLVRPSGLEPPTPTMSRWCSNQLSYGRIVFCLPVRQRGRILATYPVTGKGKKTFYDDIVTEWCANVHCVDFLNINAGNSAAGNSRPAAEQCVKAAYRRALSKMTNEDWFWIQRIRSDTITAAKVRPIIKPHQKPLGPIRGTTQSVKPSV